MTAPRLPARLLALLDLIPAGRSLVDVGCDHGLLAVAAVRSGRVPQAHGIDR
ncbi:MAG: SAM-dependent methyltransferase, partial [Myxococcales bacterium]|nr:SAM-dependent methyltransferase [Myxococcales bacterium]